MLLHKLYLWILINYWLFMIQMEHLLIILLLEREECCIVREHWVRLLLLIFHICKIMHVYQETNLNHNQAYSGTTSSYVTAQ